jgi:RHS repeat-associated protein
MVVVYGDAGAPLIIYEDRGREVRYRDGKGNEFRQEKNPYGELTGETNRLGERQNYSYDKEGRVTGQTAYSGKPYDSATGLYNYGYRDYKPEAARFTTVDPVRDGANWFAYVNNDPVNWVDPWGLECSASDKINALGDPTTYKGNINPQLTISGNPGAKYIGDNPKTGSENEDVVKYFANNDDSGATVLVKEREYSLISPSIRTYYSEENWSPNTPAPHPDQTLPLHITNTKGNEFTIINNESQEIIRQFHDVNKDGWFDFEER